MAKIFFKGDGVDHDCAHCGGTTGTAKYNSDGSLSRLDSYTTSPGSSHGHTWLDQRSDGSYSYHYELHDNH